MNWVFDAKGFSEDEVRHAFRVWGFVVIRNVLSAAEVVGVRAELDRAFGSAHLKDFPTLCSTELLKLEPVWKNLFKQSVVGSLRAALGPQLYYQNDADVQRNSYGVAGSRPHSGWHMDAGSESDQEYLRSPDYRFAKCGLYLQDFDNGWGGGIRVKPKSHRGLFETNGFKRNVYFLRRVINRMAAMSHLDVDTLQVPTKAGDLCFFDSRLLHSSASPSSESIRTIGYDGKDVLGFWPDIPPQHTKYVIYWDACNAAMRDDFLRNSRQRSASELPGMQEERFKPAVFTRILATQYPVDFPAEFVAAAAQSDVGIASLSGQEAAVYKQKLQSMQLLHP